MDLNEVRYGGDRLIEAYGDMGFRLTDGRHEGSLLLMPGKVEKLAAASHEDFCAATFAPVFEMGEDISILIIGTGERQHFLAPEMQKLFIEKKLAVEVMDSRAACRTYNVLRTDGRPVAAAIIALE
jgi:uncharacterized protein